ncbi:hypothetical protein SAMN05660657_05715 [Geodermatophilus amargosae]|uniref:Uncharacterized protein n=1 Tax=Geodermatophilus amargosae TaxID=1296565 RepID=A0A1I7DFB0_9ACTN|nr:hypothetical protein [Geodermatophilus amargosae]SFU10348.1 hypothetical protein SAMN05660657_05715 [Geodermatophilus amargosae]
MPPPIPLDEQPPVIRIPVAGSAPFNTLAVVWAVGLGTLAPADGKLHKFRVTWPTNLVLTGYDPLRPEQQRVLHSSSAWIRTTAIDPQSGIFSDANTSFTSAVDEVQAESKLDEDGRWHISVDVASSAVDANTVTQVEISSWVLCWEPR